MTGAQRSHAVLVSILLLIGVGYAAQGIGNSSATAHTLIIFMLVGVIIILGINNHIGQAGPWNANKIAGYPYIPQGG